MKRRFLSVLLALSLVFSLGTIAVFADGYGLNTSEEAIEMIKDLEGYMPEPINDNTQQSIGYGCSTEFAEKHGFSTTYLTEDEADALLRLVLEEMEEKLDKFLLKHGIQVNQYQYDALMSFTYNLGSRWMKPTSRLGGLLISNDYTTNEFASALGVYCHVGTGDNAKVEPHLVDRRIREIKLFLYGAYELTDVEQKFSTLKYEAGDGEAETDIGFYLVGSPYQHLFSAEPTAATEPYFAGWYTESGEQVTPATIVEGSTTVYARWSDTPVELELEQTEQPQQNYVEASEVFSDLKPDQWHYSYINDLYNAGVINGYEDQTFRPERTVSCGEALKMILLAAGYPEQAPVTDHWASGYYAIALENGIIEDTDFKVTQLDVEISRGTMAKIAANALGLTEYYTFPVYTDTDDLYAAILFYYDITVGYEDGTFRPERSLTRAELSTIVWRMNEEF